MLTIINLYSLASQKYKTRNVLEENLNINFDMGDPEIFIYCVVIKGRFIPRKRKVLVSDLVKNNFISIKKPWL